MSHLNSAPAAAYPLVTLKSLLENPPIPARQNRKLIGGNPFSMNGKKDLTSANGMVLSSAAVAAAANQANWANDQFESAAAQAFLGPSIWDKPNPYDTLSGAVGSGHDFKLEYMDLDEFLSENGLGGQSSGNAAHHPGAGVGSPNESSCSSPRQTHLGSEENKVSSSTGSKERESPGELPGIVHVLKDQLHHSGNEMPNDFAVSPADLALATVPGSTVNFDPRRRRFSEEELKPQPMVKKSKKQFVPDEMKDEKYWARRRKNNLAAKRSRDARRVKENQIAIRASYLEKENAKLREQLEKLTRENMLLRDKLANAAKADKNIS